jgi:hypothetical protein
MATDESAELFSGRGTIVWLQSHIEPNWTLCVTRPISVELVDVVSSPEEASLSLLYPCPSVPIRGSNEFVINQRRDGNQLLGEVVGGRQGLGGNDELGAS